MIINNSFGKLMALAIINFVVLGSVIFYLKNSSINKLTPPDNNYPSKEQVEKVADLTNNETANSSVSEEAETDFDIYAIAAEHATKNDCFIVYDNQLYDITKYFGKHPGGMPH